VIEAVILADLGFYVAHRLFHGVPWLWRFHAIHHSSTGSPAFGCVPSILDKLFGTMYMPEGQKPERYGLDEPVPHTYISQMLYPFKWARRIH
jgi:sterol desaturase/sphingolipid hydroxylase (fatty acid hydroxylase superfamily)